MDIGKFNETEIARTEEFGVYLDVDGEEVLLPNKYIPEGAKVGDNLEVFIYKDSKDRNIATTLAPKAKVGDYAYLEVKDANKIGAFLDWGLEKDLLVPHSEQVHKMREGKRYVVRVTFDEVSNRIFATEKFDKFIETDRIDLSQGDEVDLLVYRFTDLGVKVIINNQYYGLIYEDDIYKKLEIGDKVKGYIKKIREDKKIDVSLRKIGYGKVEDAKAKILKKLKAEDGFLALNDNSSPQVIRDRLQMSKGTFKKAIGGLYKERIINITDEGIKVQD
ncbi:S1-like domain-containing RNA-binding protein [Halanaerocella petrolearia]